MIVLSVTQCERIVQYMNEFGSITPLDAIRDLGITRLSSRIFDLKNAGYNIKSETVYGKNRYGETTHFSKYRIVDTEG